MFGAVVMTTDGNDVIHKLRSPPREGTMFSASANEVGAWCENVDRRLDTIDSRPSTPLLNRDQAECEMMRIVIFFPSMHRIGLNYFSDNIRCRPVWCQGPWIIHRQVNVYELLPR